MKGKRILLGITGSIAAYKSASLVRLLIKAGAEVKVIMTPSAREFITPLTLSVLSKNPVGCDAFERESGTWANHVEYGLWADAMIIAPASANTLSKMAQGACDNLLLACYLSARCPVFVAPAMDLDMWNHASVKRNLDLLKKDNIHVLLPAEGELASGLVGEGRMQEPEQVYAALDAFFSGSKPLNGKKILITAGPTYEAIDPVRFIGNRSSGKMGYALAEEAAEKGAEVILVSGPTSLTTRHASIKKISVESAEEMHKACLQHYASCDLIIMAAAVADYKAKNVALTKIKKKNSSLDISLDATVDILEDLGRKKSPSQILVGFALETDDETANAKGKLERKNLDYIILNSLKDAGAGFGHDTNKISILGKTSPPRAFSLKTKPEVARDILDFLQPTLTA